MKKKIHRRILIVGLGSIARKHLKALHAIDPAYEILALRSKRDVDTETFGFASFKHIYLFEEIPVNEIDFVIISNPTALHRTTIQAFLKYKIPLFIEKPLFEKTQPGDFEWIQEFENKNIKNYVAYVLRFHPVLKWVKEKLLSQRTKIEEVTIYCGSYLPNWREGVDFRTSYSANSKLGGGVHLDLSHELDYACWLFGWPITYQAILSSQSSLKINSTDFSHYILNYPGFHAMVTMNYYRQIPKRKLEIVFENECWEADLLSNEIFINGKLHQKFDVSYPELYEQQLRYFIDYVSGAERFSLNPIAEAACLQTIITSHETYQQNRRYNGRRRPVGSSYHQYS